MWPIFNVILIDIVLGGDNAIFIAMACRRLPHRLRKKTVFWGMMGAVVVRAALAVVAIQLMRIPLLELLGGLLLVWIAYRLLVQNHGHRPVHAGQNFWSALKTILIADTVMGIDNILAIAGAAHGNVWVLITGFFVSIPLIIWGSRLLLQWIDRYPVISYAGASMIAWTGGSLIVEDEFAHRFMQLVPYADLAIPLLLAIVVVISGLWKNARLVRV
ncbi:TerC family protein [Effusibacillus pohliae]|uniref:TerC family protein n=1 Tax=Effusibacillus pohliae TaxID=232270 RepID=UPI001FE198C8|nr:TerC family protein [Effusibacillus pohliae]